MVDHSATTAASVFQDGGEWVLALYDSAGEVIELVGLGWDGSGGFLAAGIDHVARVLDHRTLAYRGSGAWSEHEGRWSAVVYRSDWLRRSR